ncbi:enoyl-CoA hydratase/isomerase family protein [Ramlibacter sp. WS9]|uniref:enoyl-CoA hydratase/isomerase family protein n=1 Tax=Ramlibacter sp. WS9 TaxID=1882741 RepID=UPI0011438D54|nr:enoyl-CoA hydratase/isomerase family protein [Ramlibacter sp. WS9]ROZ69147.1 enoyl-CoA hydratase/isomerase family protein [Ramlibacter sp. WS9]
MPVSLQRHGAVAVLTITHPPVNSLSQPMREALWTALEEADADDGVTSIVLTGTGRGFCAGGDLGEMRSPLQQAWPGISNHLLPRIEACRKPVIAAMHGFAIGGGLELALACHYRVAQQDTRLALPEIRHGVIPPSGSQRMPRAIGVDRSLRMIVFAQYERADAFAGTSLIDTLCDGDVAAAAIDFAARIDQAIPPADALLRHRPLDRAESETALAAWRERLHAMPGSSALMRYCVDAVGYAVSAQSFDGGLAAAKRLHDQLAAALASPPQPELETPS